MQELLSLIVAYVLFGVVLSVIGFGIMTLIAGASAVSGVAKKITEQKDKGNHNDC